MKIRLLSEEIAARIAAGEVVERPSSIVKELVENSLDAGSTRIDVETQEGGQKLVCISDNGEGIPSQEVALAFRRHATSKLETAADLEKIATLGFRGEALASIAAVSRVTCTTRNAEALTATRIRIEGGTIVSQTAVGHPQGTEMVVEDLFYNVPARQKFLGSERSERRHIDAFLTRYAIAYPNISFHVTHDGRENLATPGHNDPREALLKVYGLDLGSSLLEIPPELSDNQPIQVRGFVGPTNAHRADRGYITLFINGRWIQDLRITYAVIQSYHTLLPVKRFPVAFVMVDMPPEDVDVNVHPAKAEVRFRDADMVFRAVQRAVRSTLMMDAPIAPAWQPGPSAESESAKHNEASTLQARLASLKPAPQFTWADLPETRSEGNVESIDTTPSSPLAESRERERFPQSTVPPSRVTNTLPPLRVIGQVATMFIVAEGPEGLYLIDQHAAHERVLYEQMLGEWDKKGIPSQPLLEPVAVTLPADEATQLEEQLPVLKDLGLEVESFGPNTFLVRSLPALLKHVSPPELLADIASEDNNHHSTIHKGIEALIIRKICKRAAVKAGQVLTQEEMEHLIKSLETSLNPRTCPHGRPTMLQISVEQLALQFERK